MCPLLFVRLSVRRAFACVHQRRCLASAPAMATATATTMTMTVTPAMGLSPAMTLSLRVHVLTVAWRRFQLCSLLCSAPSRLLRLAAICLRTYFSSFATKTDLCDCRKTSVSSPTARRLSLPQGSLPCPRPCLDWAASLSRAGVQCVFPVHPAMFVHRMMLICQLEKRISCKIPAFPGTLKTWIHFY